MALLLIKLYQRFISPYKGFSCAYRVHTGRSSCSALGYRSIRLLGFWSGLFVLRERIKKCGIAHRRYSGRTIALNKQAGFLDLSCDLPCDVPSFDIHHCHIGDACDIANFSSCDCGDWGSRRKKSDEQWVHIPPNVKL
ncbi:membrane protein insertion efficiency factor YidD [Methyloradius palustris]|uniref:membrane protein insertion efficiency factor YidD n=1 Tax=Methyloradius palustris TaxID=2778876 RepID=UPI001C8B4551|nr:membrane protein insertion efficiency factor YidD [Methyloradius palustris]